MYAILLIFYAFVHFITSISGDRCDLTDLIDAENIRFNEDYRRSFDDEREGAIIYYGVSKDKNDKEVRVVYEGDIYTSTDHGTSWIKNDLRSTQAWQTVTISSPKRNKQHKHGSIEVRDLCRL